MNRRALRMFAGVTLWLWVIHGFVIPPAGQQHIGSTSPADIEAGARLYSAQCSACHGAEGSLVVGVDLRRGTFRYGSSDEDLARTITRGIPGTAMLAHSFTESEVAVLIAFLRSMSSASTPAIGPAFVSGDAAAGRLLVQEKGCLSCHRIYESGSRRAINLSDIGAIRTAGEIERAVLDPGTTVNAGVRFVRAVTTDGAVITGRRLNEDSFTVQLLDNRERLVSLLKSELREYAVSRTLPEPPHTVLFTDEERRDLVTYLLSLKGLDPPLPRGVRR